MQRDKFDGEVTRVVLETEADAVAAQFSVEVNERSDRDPSAPPRADIGGDLL